MSACLWIGTSSACPNPYFAASSMLASWMRPCAAALRIAIETAVAMLVSVRPGAHAGYGNPVRSVNRRQANAVVGRRVGHAVAGAVDFVQGYVGAVRELD